VSVSTEPTVRLDIEQGVATVTLDRPPLNVLTTAMLRELEGVLRDLPQVADLRLVVLRGRGRVFSAGVDVGEHIGDALGPMLDAFLAASLRLQECPIPTLAVVHGAALGGGAELVALCDLAITTDDAKIGTPEITLGVVPPVAAAVFPRLVGSQRARALVLTGEPIPGMEAAASGLVWKSVPVDALEPEVDRVVTRFRSLSAASLRLAKRTLEVAAAAPTPLAALSSADREQREGLPRIHDADEGLRSFVEKRKPRWEHR
jgi:cyclohexa-1,5-dienecarbonyl-CoA hydratase